MTTPHDTPTRRDRRIDLAGVVVVAIAYALLATRGEVVSWLWR